MAADLGVAMQRVLASQRCKVGVVEERQVLPARYMPREWSHHQYAFEHHLLRAARHSPWLVAAGEAELLVVGANFSLFCQAHKTFSRRRVWYDMLHDRRLWPNASAASWAVGAPVLIPLQSAECGAPWADTVGSFRPRNSLLLEEFVPARQHDGSRIVSPFVVSRPEWLVGSEVSAAAPLRVPWKSRKLLFFAGHVPKLFQSTLRYSLWKQLHSRTSEATVRSPTIRCTVGSYETCVDAEARHPALARSASPQAVVDFIASHCHTRCATDNRTSCDASRVVKKSLAASAQHARAVFRRRCAPYLRMVDFERELPHMTNTRLSHDAYLRLAAAHRFCLVAPGDTWSTHKISESVALGGAGACIPVIVLPKEGAHAAAALSRMLPFASWLDYCEVAYFVREPTARANMSGVLARLAAVGEAEVRAKRRALRRVRDAFVSPPDAAAARSDDAEALGAAAGSGERWRPTAADYVLGMACEAARRARLHGAPRLAATKGGDHDRCTI